MTRRRHTTKSSDKGTDAYQEIRSAKSVAELKRAIERLKGEHKKVAALLEAVGADDFRVTKK